MNGKYTVGGASQIIRMPVIKQYIRLIIYKKDAGSLTVKGCTIGWAGTWIINQLPWPDQMCADTIQGRIRIPACASGGNHIIAVLVMHNAWSFALLILKYTEVRSCNIQIIIIQSGKIDSFIIICTVNQPGTSFRILKQCHVSAVLPVWLKAFQILKRPRWG